jgi:hypothetical protein
VTVGDPHGSTLLAGMGLRKDNDVATGDTSAGRESGSHGARAVGMAAASYLVLSVIVWRGIWTSHPTTVTTCGCGDSSLFTWFLEWPAYAISHGMSPLYSTALFHPSGVNLLANTSVLAVGVLLTPITWLFGPITTLNVALTLAPVLSALSMFLLVRRWVSWAPAAFVAGLFYGFSPFVLVSLVDAHLMLGMAVVPPLCVLCLDELLFRQRRRPVLMGFALGLLVTLQFFIGTELLVIMAIGTAIGLVFVVVHGIFLEPDALRRRTRYALIGLASAVLTASTFLAYPVWFALAGPGHYSGSIWPDSYPLGSAGTSIMNYVFGAPASPALEALYRRTGGPQGPLLSTQFFGIGAAIIVTVGIIIWHRDLRLWLFGTLAMSSGLLSLGLKKGFWTPWQELEGLPLVQNIIPSRIVVLTYLAIAVMLGLIIDHARTDAIQWSMARPGSSPREPSERRGSRLDRWVGGLAGAALAGVALVPVAAYLAPSIPIATQRVVLPTWFRTVAPRLEGNQVLLVLPAPFAILQSALTWQAVNRMHYAMVGGAGPGSVPSRAGKERAGQVVLGSASFSFRPQAIEPGAITAARQAMDGWGVTMVVIPDQAGLPSYEQISSVPFAVALVTAATGVRPKYQAGAWVWTRVNHDGPALNLSPTAFSHCIHGHRATDISSVNDVTTCVLHSSSG